MFFDLHDLGLLVEVVWVRHSMAASGCSQGRILSYLNDIPGCVGQGRCPDRAAVVDDRLAYGFIGGGDDLLVLTPG